MSIVRQNIGYFCESLQAAHNAGLNSFAALLLAESYGDQIERFDKGGVLFLCQDHSGRPIWVTISAEPPVKDGEEPAASRAEGEPTDADWEAVRARFDWVRQVYRDMVGQPGVNTSLALAVVFQPLADRYDAGERTRFLYDAMGGVQ